MGWRSLRSRSFTSSLWWILDGWVTWTEPFFSCKRTRDFRDFFHHFSGRKGKTHPRLSETMALPTMKNPFQATFFVSFLGWWQSDPFKGCWWPPTIEDKRSLIESPGKLNFATNWWTSFLFSPRYPLKMNECPSKSDLFKRKVHLPTIDF